MTKVITQAAVDVPQAETDEATYQIGYCKPPKHSQFKKGQSGNRRGVPKPMSIEENAAAVLKRLSTISENGKRRRVTMQEVLLLTQMKKGIEGDNKAAKLVLGLAQKAPPLQSPFRIASATRDSA